MKFLDLFSGIGGFRVGMERAGHECVGFCEFDKYAVASYTSMYLITNEQRAYLGTLTRKQRQEEILKEEYRNGEWYAKDIRTVNAGNVPRADIWCFGAPCTSFSISGLRKGLDGQSGLVREVFRIIREIPEADRPEWIIYENVKGMLSSNRGRDYLAILMEMDGLGYDIQWQNFNSKDYGVPQNRERIYTIGHLRTKGRKEILPISPANGEVSLGINQVGMLQKEGRDNPNQYRVYETDGLSPSLNTMSGGGLQPHIISGLRERERMRFFGLDYNVGGEEREIANCVTARYNNGVTNFKQEGTCVGIVIGDKE